MDDGTDTNITTNRETVQTWVESSGAKPGFQTDANGTRTPYVYYPETDTDESVEEASWDEFFETFEDRDLALVRHGNRPNEGPGELELVDRTRVNEETRTDSGIEPKDLEKPGGVGTTEGGRETATDVVSDTTESPTLSSGDVGKRVVNASGEQVGVVTEVDDDAGTVYVDSDPGITERIKTRLGWEGHDEDVYSVSADRIEAIEDDELRLKSL